MQINVRNRSASLFNGIALVALIAILALVALVTKPPPPPNVAEFAPIYRSLLVIASGIQGAGPNLTAKTFEQALQKMQFPNPNSGTAPYWQQAIGFAAGDYTWAKDYAIRWFDPSLESRDEFGAGSWCYVDRGARFKPGAFPRDADAKLFDRSQPCR